MCATRYFFFVVECQETEIQPSQSSSTISSLQFWSPDYCGFFCAVCLTVTRRISFHTSTVLSTASSLFVELHCTLMLHGFNMFPSSPCLLALWVARNELYSKWHDMYWYKIHVETLSLISNPFIKSSASQDPAFRTLSLKNGEKKAIALI